MNNPAHLLPFIRTSPKCTHLKIHNLGLPIRPAALYVPTKMKIVYERLQFVTALAITIFFRSKEPLVEFRVRHLVHWREISVSPEFLPHWTKYFSLVYGHNQVSVSGTETKFQFQYRYRSRNFFFRNWNFSIFFMFSFLGWCNFLKAWNWTQIFKNNLKTINIL